MAEKSDSRMIRVFPSEMMPGWYEARRDDYDLGDIRTVQPSPFASLEALLSHEGWDDKPFSFCVSVEV